MKRLQIVQIAVRLEDPFKLPLEKVVDEIAVAFIEPVAPRPLLVQPLQLVCEHVDVSAWKTMKTL